MPLNPHEHFDQSVLDQIEHSPVGAVPNTPAYQDAIGRLYATHQAFPDADHAQGHVTARSLAALPSFQASNISAFLEGKINPDEIETNLHIYDRYILSLAPEKRARAESFRAIVAGKQIHHRAKLVGTTKVIAPHDPIHTLFLVPGGGPHPGLPGNYLHGAVLQLQADSPDAACVIQVHDSDDGAAVVELPTLAEALLRMRDVIESAPFHMSELEAFGFKEI